MKQLIAQFPPKDPIPLDINDPRCPQEVIHSIVADTIRRQYSEVGLPVDPLLLPFLKSQPEGRGYDWQDRVWRGLHADGITVELVEKWVTQGLPRGLFRADVRGLLKCRQALEQEKELGKEPEKAVDKPPSL